MSDTPNRLKFASLIRKLDPLHRDFTKEVEKLQSEYDQREYLISRLIEAFGGQGGNDIRLDLLASEVVMLKKHIRAAIERWVVDNR